MSSGVMMTARVFPRTSGATDEPTVETGQTNLIVQPKVSHIVQIIIARFNQVKKLLFILTDFGLKLTIEF